MARACPTMPASRPDPDGFNDSSLSSYGGHHLFHRGSFRRHGGAPSSLPHEINYHHSARSGGVGPHATASVAFSIDGSILPRRSLSHADSRSASSRSRSPPPVAGLHTDPPVLASAPPMPVPLPVAPIAVLPNPALVAAPPPVVGLHTVEKTCLRTLST
jgi:hypothetical protein